MRFCEEDLVVVRRHSLEQHTLLNMANLAQLSLNYSNFVQSCKSLPPRTKSSAPPVWSPWVALFGNVNSKDILSHMANSAQLYAFSLNYNKLFENCNYHPAKYIVTPCLGSMANIVRQLKK